MDDHHLQQSIGCGQELAHGDLEEALSGEFFLLGGDLDVEFAGEGDKVVDLALDEGIEDLEDGIKDELVEGTLKSLSFKIGGLCPFLGLWVEKVVSPQTFHHLGLVDTEFLGVSDGKLSDGEGPAVETGAESNGALLGPDLDITKSLVEVGRDDDVDRFDGSEERLIQVFLLDLKLEQGTINLVDDDNGLDTFTQGLSEDGLGLDADTFNGVDDDQGAIGDSQGSGDLGGEVDVTGRVDQIDQEFVTFDFLGGY